MKRATGNAETVPGTPRRYGGHLTNDKIVCKEHARYTWITEENKLKSSRLLFALTAKADAVSLT